MIRIGCLNRNVACVHRESRVAGSVTQLAGVHHKIGQVTAAKIDGASEVDACLTEKREVARRFE
jgi:hypothetical protein